MAARGTPKAEVEIAQPKPVVRWKGLGAKASTRQLADDMDASERRRAAQWVIKEVKSWSEQSKLLADIGNAEEEKVLWERMEEKVQLYEAPSSWARIRAWTPWTTWIRAGGQC